LTEPQKNLTCNRIGELEGKKRDCYSATMFLSWRLKTVLKQMVRTTILILVFLSILLHPNLPGLAQEEPPTGAIYIVQEGDTMWSFAVRFGISI
jgi:hypothetical protein